jgi:hypothetical protein
MGGYAYAGDNPVSKSDPTGLALPTGSGCFDNPNCNGPGDQPPQGWNGPGYDTWPTSNTGWNGPGFGTGTTGQYPVQTPVSVNLASLLTGMMSLTPDLGLGAAINVGADPGLIGPAINVGADPGLIGPAINVPADFGKMIDAAKEEAAEEEAAEEGTAPTQREQGAAGVQQTISDLVAAGGRVLGQEITLRAAGWRARVDLYAELPNGQRVFIEVKTGPGAELSPNQEAVYAETRSTGAVPVGQKAAEAEGLTPGVSTGPTPVYIVWQPWPLMTLEP